MKNANVMNISTIMSVLIALLTIMILMQGQTALALSTTMILGIDDDSDKFALYDLETNEARLLDATILSGDDRGNGRAPKEIESLTYGGDGIFYGVQSYNWKTTSQLYKFEISDDLNDITVETVGTGFDASNIDAVEYADGMLYAVDNSRNKNELVAVDTLTGQVVGRKSVTGDSGAKKFEGLAYKDGILYGSATTNDGKKRSDGSLTTGDHSSSLYTIDLVTGEAGLVGQIGFGQVESLTFAGDTLYGTSDTSDAFLEIALLLEDTGGNLGKVLSDWGSDIEGIAGNSMPDAAESPEPATMFLLGAGLVGLAALKRRFDK